MNCEEMILSEDTYDYLISAFLEYNLPEECRQRAGPLYQCVSVYQESSYAYSDLYSYCSLPKLYGLLSMGNLESAGIIKARFQPSLGLDGRGIMLGFIDTGINFADEVFLRPDRTSRVIAIWDQTKPGEMSGKRPEGFLYGTEYTAEDIVQAMKAEDPYSVVSQRDTNGHGTYIASVAAGNDMTETEFSGAAPEADILMVKLKPAKKNLREYYQIRDDADAFEENDIMTGAQWLLEKARAANRQLVICIALGTNSGSHNGNLPLARTLGIYASYPGVVVVAGTGNETTRAHHYEGIMLGENEYEDVEIRVSDTEKGFQTELWARSPEVFSVAVRSPDGEVIPRVFVTSSKAMNFDFVLSKTKLEVTYRTALAETGEFLVVLRFIDISPGIWTIRVYSDLYITGKYNMWLPMDGFISPETVFLRPQESTTLTSPSDSENIIAVAAYNDVNYSIYLYSGRGNTPDGAIKPDLAAPGTEASGCGAAGNRIKKSGSSASAAITAGAAALLCQWARESLGTYLNSADARTYLIRGADRKNYMRYPNKEWGYGTLDLYGAILNVRYQGWSE